MSLLKQEAKFNRERESLQRKMQLMDKQLQKKTVNELGDGAEIDLFEALRESFPGDKITRIPKGRAGADILHEVLYKGESWGKIICDSKNCQGWQNAFVAKLRQDQVEAGAEHRFHLHPSSWGDCFRRCGLRLEQRAYLEAGHMHGI